MENNLIPRRISLYLLEPAELKIVDAVNEIEKLPPDLRLTNAQNLLHQARELVSDFIDEQIKNKI